jgi:peptide/nickel transport system substrate-binding protein
MNAKIKWFTLLAILVLIGSSLAGCTAQTQAPVAQPTSGEVAQPTEPAAQPTTVPEKSSITVVIAEDPPTFNGAINQNGFDVLVMELTMLGLADLDENGNPFAELATELPSVENGDVVIDEENGTMDVTWKLRQDIQWADGTPVTANDVVFTYEAVVDPETGYWIPGIDYVDSVEKVDDYTAVVHYNAIYPGYLTQFGG